MTRFAQVTAQVVGSVFRLLSGRGRQRSLRATQAAGLSPVWHCGARYVLGVAVTASVALTPAPASAYRTLSELPDYPADELIRWSSSAVQFELSGSELPSGLSAGSFRGIARQAFASWAKPSCSAFRFRLAAASSSEAQPGDGANTIEWVSKKWKRYGTREDAAVTDIFVEEVNGHWRIVEADIYLNAANFTWTTGESDDDDERRVQTVLVHELGHALGLAHPCEPGAGEVAPKCRRSHESSVMFPKYRHDVDGTLLDDDAEGLCELYPETTCRETGCRGAQECLNGQCVERCGGALCAGRCEQDRCELECEGPNCLVGADCEKNRDCPEWLSCVGDGDSENRTCQAGEGRAGDPCSAGRDCESSVCSSGSCLAACSTDEDCQRGRCSEALAGLRACRGEVAPLGDSCEEPGDCLGGRCVAQEDDGFCSRSCGDAAGECPEHWKCDVVEELAVCVPEPGGACSVKPIGRLPGSQISLWALFASIAFVLRRQKFRFVEVVRKK